MEHHNENRNKNTRPTWFPFGQGQDKHQENNDWISQFSEDFHMDYTPGPEPTFPDSVRKEQGRTNITHGKHVYHIWGVNKEHIPGVHSNFGHNPILPPISISTETRDNYTRREVVEKSSSFKTDQKAIGIVPSTFLSNESPERFLPAVSRSQVRKMTTFPFLQYTGSKKKLKNPYEDTGFVYPEDDTTPRYNEKFWSSVTSLKGQRFSKRKTNFTLHDELPVVGFDGGGKMDDKSEGIRCGYSWSYSTVRLE